MSKRLYTNQNLLDKQFLNLLDMDSLLGKTLGKHENNFKNLNILNLYVLNEKFYKLKLTIMVYSHFIFNFLLFPDVALKT